MNMKKGNAGVTLLIVLLFIVVIALSVFIVWDKLNNNNNNVLQNNGQNNENNNQQQQHTKVDLSASELQKIEEFINKAENNPFAVITYFNPAELFNDKNTYNTTHYLKYAIQLSDYSVKLTKDQLSLIYGTEEPLVNVYGTSIADISKLLQNKMNYTYSDQILAENFKINEKVNMYLTMISDSMYCELDVISGYAFNGKIYVTVTGNRTLTLTEQNGNYYFYACDGIDGF